MYGIKFEDRFGLVLLAAGKTEIRSDEFGFGVKIVELRDGERLVGVKSTQNGFISAQHFDL